MHEQAIGKGVNTICITKSVSQCETADSLSLKYSKFQIRSYVVSLPVTSCLNCNLVVTRPYMVCAIFKAKPKQEVPAHYKSSCTASMSIIATEIVLTCSEILCE